MKKLENKSIFITGGLSGIGKACAIAAAKEGGNIIVADRNTANTDAVMEEIRKDNKLAMFIDCDVSNFEQVGNAIRQVIEKFGKWYWKSNL